MRALRNRLNESAARYYAAIEMQAASQDAASSLSGIYAGYDAVSSRHLIRVAGGGLIKARSITTGSVRIGDRVSVSFAKGSNEAFLDAMPR